MQLEAASGSGVSRPTFASTIEIGASRVGATAASGTTAASIIGPPHTHISKLPAALQTWAPLLPSVHTQPCEVPSTQRVPPPQLAIANAIITTSMMRALVISSSGPTRPIGFDLRLAAPDPRHIHYTRSVVRQAREREE
jgi:hypothetical protein